MSDLAVTERRLAVSEIAEALGCSVSTVSRLFDGGALRIVRDRTAAARTSGWRLAYESQIAYIATALKARRPGSLEEFGREWLKAHPLPAPVPEVV